MMEQQNDSQLYFGSGSATQDPCMVSATPTFGTKIDRVMVTAPATTPKPVPVTTVKTSPPSPSTLTAATTTTTTPLATMTNNSSETNFNSANKETVAEQPAKSDAAGIENGLSSESNNSNAAVYKTDIKITSPKPVIETATANDCPNKPEQVVEVPAHQTNGQQASSDTKMEVEPEPEPEPEPVAIANSPNSSMTSTTANTSAVDLGQMVDDSLNVAVIRRNRRLRFQTQLFQSPLPNEEAILAKLAKSHSSAKQSPRHNNDNDNATSAADAAAAATVTNQTAKPQPVCIFNRSEFLAVRSPGNSYFVCRALKNIYKMTRKCHVQWLESDEKPAAVLATVVDETQKKSGPDPDASQTKRDVSSDSAGGDATAGKPHDLLFKMDFCDTIDFESILTNVRMQHVKGDRKTFVLPADEQTRIGHILEKIVRIETGGSASPPDTKDGIDISQITSEMNEKVLVTPKIATATSNGRNRTKQASASSSTTKTVAARKPSLKIVKAKNTAVVTSTTKRQSTRKTPVRSQTNRKSPGTTSGKKPVAKKGTARRRLMKSSTVAADDEDDDGDESDSESDMDSDAEWAEAIEVAKLDSTRKVTSATTSKATNRVPTSKIAAAGRRTGSKKQPAVTKTNIVDDAIMSSDDNNVSIPVAVTKGVKKVAVTNKAKAGMVAATNSKRTGTKTDSKAETKKSQSTDSPTATTSGTESGNSGGKLAKVTRAALSRKKN